MFQGIASGMRSHDYAGKRPVIDGLPDLVLL